MKADCLSVRVRFFGELSLVIGEQTYRCPPKKASLFAHIVLRGLEKKGAPCSREWLAEQLWSGKEAQDQLNNLRFHLSGLRNTPGFDVLVQEDILSIDQDVITFHAHYAVLDVCEFEKQANPPSHFSPAQKVGSLLDALDAYRGELLPTFADEYFASKRREFQQMYEHIYRQLAHAYAKAGLIDDAIDCVATLYQFDEEDEANCRLWAFLHAQQDARKPAIDLLRGLECSLDEKWGGELENETEELLRCLEKGLPLKNNPIGSEPSDLPSLRARKQRRSISVITPLIGRAKETSAIKKHLGSTRLLTLVGAGGIGKTKLAEWAAHDWIEVSGQGAQKIELGALKEASLIASMIRAALEIKENHLKSPLESIIDHIGDENLLLILDNCEHLILDDDALASGEPVTPYLENVVITLLHSCPNLRVLATSRKLLNVPGEQTYAIPCLSLPDAAVSLASKLYDYEASQLFIERANSRKSDFRVTDHNAAAIASICCRLDGLPLAIELAAARVRSLSVQDIYARLDKRFLLLIGGSHVSLPRHQSMQASMDWSYDSLDDKTRLLFERLSVFQGGWSLEAAERICGDMPEDVAALPPKAIPGINDWQILALLSSLIERSLVLAEEHHGEMRYRFLDTVREYAREKREERDENDVISQRHARFFLTFAEKAWKEMISPDAKRWVNWLNVEHDNFRSLLSWCATKADQGETGLRLTYFLSRFWATHGYLSEGMQRMREALAHPGAQRLTMARANTLRHLADMSRVGATYDAALTSIEEALVITRVIGDLQGEAQTLRVYSTIEADTGQQTKALSHAQEAKNVFHELGDFIQEAMSLNAIGIAAGRLSDLDTARAAFEEGLVLSAKIKSSFVEAMMALNLGHVAVRQSRIEEALSLSERSLKIHLELGDELAILYTIDLCATAALAFGDAEGAARLFGAAEHLRERSGALLNISDQQLLHQRIATAKTRLSEAEFSAAMEMGSVWTIEQAAEYALQSLSEKKSHDS